MTLGQTIADNAKNVLGWRTSDKLVALSVDDFGSIRLCTKDARDRLTNAGIVLKSRFDRLDAMETRRDLEALLEVLASVSDRDGRAATVTAYALTANPDWQAMTGGGSTYVYETLPKTFERLEATQPESYRGAWDLWREGVRMGMLRPQFHGREHFNVEMFDRKLKSDDQVLAANLRNQSLVGVDGELEMPGVGFTHAFGMTAHAQLEKHKRIIANGMDLFEKTFGVRSITFTPPAHKLHPELYGYVETLGIRAIDKPRRSVFRINKGRELTEFNTLGRKRGQGHATLVRNVVFEPSAETPDNAVKLALHQIAAAFRWHKPALISSHRVNFAGHIEPKNRAAGLAALQRLLRAIIDKWPDVQFVGADEIADKILKKT